MVFHTPIQIIFTPWLKRSPFSQRLSEKKKLTFSPGAKYVLQSLGS